TRLGDLRPLSGGRRTGVRNRVTPTHCGRCGTELPADVLACPACGALVHAETLKRLAADAEAASRAGEFSAARDHWSAALHLLPPQSRQHAAVRERIAGLTRRTDTAQPKQTAAATEQPWWSRGAAASATSEDDTAELQPPDNIVCPLQAETQERDHDTHAERIGRHLLHTQQTIQPRATAR